MFHKQNLDGCIKYKFESKTFKTFYKYLYIYVLSNGKLNYYATIQPFYYYN